jgi:hypothetical protein
MAASVLTETAAAWGTIAAIAKPAATAAVISVAESTSATTARWGRRRWPVELQFGSHRLAAILREFE